MTVIWSMVRWPMAGLPCVILRGLFGELLAGRRSGLYGMDGAAAG